MPQLQQQLLVSLEERLKVGGERPERGLHFIKFLQRILLNSILGFKAF